MSYANLLCWEVKDLITVRHNIMVYCFEIVYMDLFTLETQITWTRFTKVLCGPRALGTLMYPVWYNGSGHDVEDVGIKITIL